MTSIVGTEMQSDRYERFIDFDERARLNQLWLRTNLKSTYDFIVCGSGSSGSVVAARLAENPQASVLLVEAGGDDDLPEVMEIGQWPRNLGSERDWGFQSEPSPHVHHRAIPLSMGKVLGGGSSINVMAWLRGHRRDWDFFAAEAGDPAWSYEAVLEIYRQIEDWHGAPDPKYRGVGGPVFVEPAPDPNPVAPAMLEAARSIGIPTFDSANGRMMETAGGASIADIRARNGRRHSMFRSYVYPNLVRPNLTVLTHALVTRLIFDGRQVTGVEISHGGRTQRIRAANEVILSLGAIHTPKVLMQSGIGDEAELQRVGIPVRQHLPGVGRNLQDHVGIQCVWEYEQAMPPRNTISESSFFWKTKPNLTAPDMFAFLVEVPISSAENAARFTLPAAGWTFFGAVALPESRGRIRLTGPGPLDPVRIEANFLSHPDDLKTAIDCVKLCREIGNSAPLCHFAKREVMPGDLQGKDLENFVRDGAVTYWHQTCTAKMGRDALSVVDANLKVYGVENLRIADGSIMPRVTTGNTMAPCVIIGERAAAILYTEYGLRACAAAVPL